MKIRVYTVDVQFPRWLRRAIIFVAIPAVPLLGLIHILRADVTVPNTFTDGEVLSAAQMNANFSALQTGINELGARVTTLEGASGGSAVPPGSMVAFAGSTAPTGWLLCNGAAVDRTQYATLFAAIGVAYGSGNGSTTFNLPDLRAAGVRGAGTSTKFVANSTVTLGQVINDQFQGHYHKNSVGSSYLLNFSSAYGGSAVTMDLNGTSADGGRCTSPTPDGTNGTPRTGAETTGKAIGANYIIKS